MENMKERLWWCLPVREPSNAAVAVLILFFFAGALLFQLSLLTRQDIQAVTAEASSDVGTLTLTVDSAGGIRFAVNSVNFGTGKINTSAGNTVCVLDTNGTNDLARCTNFTTVTDGFQVENDGSANASVEKRALTGIVIQCHNGDSLFCGYIFTAIRENA